MHYDAQCITLEVDMPTNAKSSITVRLKPEVAKGIRRVAEHADRSVSWLIARLVEEHLAIRESHMRAIAKGMESAREGRVMDMDEFLARRDRKLRKRRERSSN